MCRWRDSPGKSPPHGILLAIRETRLLTQKGMGDGKPERSGSPPPLRGSWPPIAKHRRNPRHWNIRKGKSGLCCRSSLGSPCALWFERLFLPNQGDEGRRAEAALGVDQDLFAGEELVASEGLPAALRVGTLHEEHLSHRQEGGAVRLDN